MSADIQRVVVIQDASRDVNPSAIKSVLQNFSLNPGDVLILFGVLHQVINPMGYKVKVDQSSMFGVNPKFIATEVAKKEAEYSNNLELMEISNQCQMEQVEFQIKVQAGSTPKVVASKAAKSLKATWVILDRQMKKDKKYFTEKLSCGISRLKRDNSIEQLRGPKTKNQKEKGRSDKGQVRYDEMIPEMIPTGISVHTHPKTSLGKEHVDLDEGIPQQNKESSPYSKSPTNDQAIIARAPASSMGYQETSSSNFTDAKFSSLNIQEEEHIASAAGEATKKSPPVPDNQQRKQKFYNNTGDSGEQHKQHKNSDNWMGLPDVVFNNSTCSSCNNKRPMIGWQKDFSYAELQAATRGFSDNNFLSEGGFGKVFRGELNGLKVAVKQHNSASFQGEREFKSEVNVLSKAIHENLVMLLGSCSEGSHRLLVYEYVCNGSLDQHLSKHTRKPLSWQERMKIARGAAKGLQYLHENNIIHRDMRPNNILITHDHEARLGDFGLARTQPEDSDQTLETRVVGTLGYLAPEYAEYGKVSTMTDVYAFGVVLLQMITGLKTTDKILGGRSLVGWARPLLKERNYPDLLDHKIIDSHDVHQLFWMVRIAERCLSTDPKKRITMDKVVEALDHIMGCNNADSIKGFSPAQSDSPSSTQEYPYDLTEEEDTSFSIKTTTTATSQMSARFPPSPPLRFPPSPTPVLAISSTRLQASSIYYRSSRGTDDEWRT